MTPRTATPADHRAIASVIEAAFPTPDEARLVERLRADGDVLVELVAERDGVVVGHILFSVLRLERAPDDVSAAALAPVAVTPHAQNQGVGSALVRAGVEACRALDLEAIVVLGHPDYYPRFGFTAEAARGIAAPFSGEAFMAMMLKPGVLDAAATARYAPAFRL